MRRGLGSSCDFARTITFGGVAVGSRKAKDVATAAGSIIASGLITASCEAAASTGNIAAAVPIEENTCEHKVITTMITKSRRTPCACGTKAAK